MKLIKLSFISICELLFGLSCLPALKLCEEISFSCSGGDWYTACYGSGEAYGCKVDVNGFGTGFSGTVDDCGCGDDMKIKWQCSNTSGTKNNPGNPNTGGGAFCWCRLGNTDTAVGPWIFSYVPGVQQCFNSCAYYCTKTLAEDQVFRAALCMPV